MKTLNTDSALDDSIRKIFVEQLKNGNSIRVASEGISMHPFIRNGDYLIIDPIEYKDVKIGNIVVYTRDSGYDLVTHRVVKKYRDADSAEYLATRGDGDVFQDPPVYAGQLCGKVIAIETKEKRLIKLDNGLGRLVAWVITRLYQNWLIPRKLLGYFCRRISAVPNVDDGFLRPEDKLIILLSRRGYDEGQAKAMRGLLQSDLNWDYILKKTDEERVSWLMYHTLQLLNFTSYVPRRILGYLEKGYYLHYARNTLVLEQTKKIIAEFSQNGIKAIVLKGIFLAEHIYQDIALRPMDDVDILIKKDGLKQANNVLNSLGYLSPPNYEDALENRFNSSINTLLYINPGRGDFFVHLHWHIVNSTWPLDSLVNKIDMARIWSYAEHITFGDVETFALAPEHFLIYLAQHCFSHSLNRLILLSDILETLKYYQDRIDWKVVNEEARRFNLSHILYYSLFLSAKRLGYNIPELKRIEPVKISFLEKVSSFLMNRNIGFSLSAYCIYLSMQDGLIGKLKFIKRTIFPSAYVMAHNFNLPISEIKNFHYYRRIVNNLPRCLP